MRRLHKLAVATAVVALAAGCGGGGSGSKASNTSVGNTSSGSHSPASSAPSSPAPTSSSPDASATVVVIKPAADTANADPASQIQVSVANGKLTSVTAQLSGGNAVAGTLDPSGASWTSADPIGIGHTYLVTAVAMGDDGKQQIATSQFST